MAPFESRIPPRKIPRLGRSPQQLTDDGPTTHREDLSESRLRQLPGALFPSELRVLRLWLVDWLMLYWVPLLFFFFFSGGKWDLHQQKKRLHILGIQVFKFCFFNGFRVS